MSDDTKRANRRDDRSHQTMPPELRPFARPEPVQRLVAPEDEPEFNAAILALRLLNGGPAADPFYVDPKADAVAEPKPAAAPSVKVYVPPIGARGKRGPPVRFDCEEADPNEYKAYQEQRAAELAAVKSAAGASETSRGGGAKERKHQARAIDIRPFQAMAAEHARQEAAKKREADIAALDLGPVDGHTKQIDLRVFREMRAEMKAPVASASSTASTDGEDEPTLEQLSALGREAANSPWAKDAAMAPIVVGDLPSSLAPGARPEPAPESEKAAGVPVGGNTGTRVMGVLAVVAVLAFVAFQLMPKTPPQEGLVPVPVRSAAPAVEPPTASGVAVPPTAAPSVSAAVPPPPPAGTVDVDAGPSVAPTAPIAPAKPRAKIDDPYDASAPAKTVEVAVAPPPVAPVISAAPSIPPAPTVAPSTKPSLVGGDKGVF